MTEVVEVGEKRSGVRAATCTACLGGGIGIEKELSMARNSGVGCAMEQKVGGWWVMGLVRWEVD